MLLSTLFWNLILSLIGTQPSLSASDHFDLIELSDGVYACISRIGGGAICNAGLIDLGEETIVFDPFISPNVAEELPELVEQLGLSPIAYVVNSHYHNDHIRGNQVFGAHVKVVSTQTTRELIEQEEPAVIADEKQYVPGRLAYFDSLLQTYPRGDVKGYQALQLMEGYFRSIAESLPILETRLPDLTFDNKMVLHGTKREVQLLSWGKGHTAGDLVLFLPEEQIVFTGDLVFKDLHPYLPDGYPEEWHATIDHIRELGVKQLVPGHGPVGTAADLDQMQRYLEMVEKTARDLLAAGMKPKEMEVISAPPPFGTWWLPNFFTQNLQFMAAKLSEEKD